MRNCCFGSDFKIQVNLLLVVATSYRLSVAIVTYHLSYCPELAIVPELMGVLKHPEHPHGYATALHQHPAEDLSAER
jgi:hypothetical protein